MTFRVNKFDFTRHGGGNRGRWTLLAFVCVLSIVCNRSRAVWWSPFTKSNALHATQNYTPHCLMTAWNAFIKSLIRLQGRHNLFSSLAILWVRALESSAICVPGSPGTRDQNAIIYTCSGCNLTPPGMWCNASQLIPNAGNPFGCTDHRPIYMTDTAPYFKKRCLLWKRRD